jgi:hypothetical protein
VKRPVRPWPHRLPKLSDFVGPIGFGSAGFVGPTGPAGPAVAVVAVFGSDSDYFGSGSYFDFFGSWLTTFPL